MSRIFWVDGQSNRRITFEQFLHDLRSKSSVSKIICFPQAYESFLELIACWAGNEDCVILNGNYSPSELVSLGVSQEQLKARVLIEDRLSSINSFDQLLDTLYQNRQSWRLAFYTSGTTGVPKKIEHGIKTLARNLRRGSKYEKDVWGLCYHPAHFAGVQVLLQAFFNKNQIVNFFQSEPGQFSRLLEEQGVTRFSATPTFLRTVATTSDQTNSQVRSITSGGERFDSLLLERVHQLFPNAKIHNIYASTEVGSLFVSNGSEFEIPQSLVEKVRIEDGELQVHRELVAKLSESGSGDWYKTGDIVEMVGERRFRFIHRKSELLNVGGYNVNPIEVETALKNVDGVKDVQVRARSNSVTGSILVADIVAFEPSNELKSKLRETAKEQLQSWKVPRVFTFVDDLKTGHSGKRVRT